MTVNQPSQDPNKDAATSAWEQEVTQATNRMQHQIDNINESVVASTPTVAIYSKTQDGTVQQFTPFADGDGFVAYFKYTDELPTLPVSGLTFSAYSDEEIDVIIKQYIEQNARPTNPGTTSYEVSTGGWLSSNGWSKQKLDRAGINIWFSEARIKGQAGQTVTAKWSNAKLLYGGAVANGILYYNAASTGAPSAPTATGYDYDSGVFTGLTSGWQYVPITSAMGGGTTISHKHWQVTFHVETSEVTNGQIITFGTVEGFIPIGSNLQSDTYSAGSAGWKIERATGNAEFNNITARGNITAESITSGTLNAARIASTSINADNITSGTIDANNVTLNNLNANKITTGNLTATNVNFGVIMQVVQGSYSGTTSGFATLTATNNNDFNTILVAIANCYVFSGSSEQQGDGSNNPSSGSNTLTLTGTGVNLNVGVSAPTSNRNEAKSSTLKSGTLTKGATYTASGTISGAYNFGGSGNILIFEVKI